MVIDQTVANIGCFEKGGAKRPKGVAYRDKIHGKPNNRRELSPLHCPTKVRNASQWAELAELNP